MTQHILPLRKYFMVFGALLALTFATVAIASIDLGPLNVVIALTIATGKALLVGLFFMHLLYTRHRTKIMAVAGLLWLLILIALTLSDVLTRGWLPVTGQL
jgi:cytochrome c oxidase subunit 4